MSVRHFYLIAVAAILGCASSSGNPGTPRVFRRQNLVTAEEIATAHADVNSVYDALARLRPNWLATHGPTSVSTGGGAGVATVFVNGVQYGDFNSLRSMPAHEVAEMRYYDVTEAGARFGLRGGTSGVIEIKTKVR